MLECQRLLGYREYQLDDVMRVGGQLFPLGVNRRTRMLRMHPASKLIGACRRGCQALHSRITFNRTRDMAMSRLTVTGLTGFYCLLSLPLTTGAQ